MSANAPASSRLQALQQQLQPLRTAWIGLSARERRMVLAAGLALLIAASWLIAIAPALRTLRDAPAQRAVQEQQLARMRQWQGEARTHKQQPRISPEESQRVLQELGDRLLGPGSVTLQGAQVQAQFKGVSPEAVAQWLQQARTLGRALPQQMQLERTSDGWHGTMVLRLPS